MRGTPRGENRSATRYWLWSTDGGFCVLWLCAAALVTVLRFFHAVAPGHDLGFQLQAAQNLLAGNGLSFYDHRGPDLSESAGLFTLTGFTSGYSLLAAALFSLGFGVGLVIKVVGSTATLLGWWGWGKLAGPFFSEGLKRGVGWKSAAYAIAAFTPLLFTPGWGGTDILLWAAVPWVTLCLVRASDENVRAGRFDGLAGVLCGLALLMRYASVFLAVYAACVILWQSRLRVSVLTRRWAVFGLGLLPALTLQIYINYFLSSSGATPGGLMFNIAPGAVVGRLWHGMSLLHTANYAWSFWVPGVAVTVLFPEAGGAVSWQLGIALVSFILLALAVKTYGNRLATSSRDPRVLASGLFVALPFTLLMCMMFGSYDYVGDQRYYMPIVPLSVFVAYSIASVIDFPKRRSVTRFLQASCALYLIGYVAMTLVYAIFLVTPSRLGNTQREKLMGTELHRWPSMAITYELSPARRFVMQRLKEEPDSLLLTSRTGVFHWDPAVDRSRLSDLGCNRLRANQLSGPVNILIYTFDVGAPRELSYYTGNGITGRLSHADCFERLPYLNVLRRFPEEGIKVLESRVGAGQRVILKP